jgi:uncharacterized glyoxalase superfamily protein PhnB
MVTPRLLVPFGGSGGAEAIDFYRRVFGAEQVRRMERPGGSMRHAATGSG